jgi:hypothetical protein
MPFFMCAQSFEITGVVSDSINNPIAFATVIAATTASEDQLLGYTTTNSNGNYVLNIKTVQGLERIYIIYRHLNHSIKIVPVKAVTQNLNVQLPYQPNKLNDIIVNAKKTVAVRGDTITYHVEGLLKEKDYTIEEVIARIPGVTISDNGQISYENKAISHLYINGVDLLEGKYNIATRGIPASAVKDIDIMQKHNHARIDIGKTDSDNVAFNLKIKENKSVIFGSARGDIGVPFVTGSGEVTPIYLREKIQDIASLKVNNIGKSLTDYGTTLTSGNTNLSYLKIEDSGIINKPDLNGTVISNKYWLDNESYSVTNDALYKTASAALFKVGLNHNYNFNEIERNDNSAFYFDNDSIIVNRNTRNQLLEHKYDAGIVAEINEPNLYLKNKTTINVMNSNGESAIIQNEQPINAGYASTTFNIANTLEFKNTIKGKIWNSGVLVNYQKIDEELRVLPAQFQDVLPGALIPALTRQSNAIDRFNAGAFTAYDFKIGKAKLQFKQTLQFSDEQLLSDLSQENETQISGAVFPFKASYRLSTLTSTTALKSSWEWNKFKLTADSNLKFLSLNQNEQETNVSTVNKYLFLEPAITTVYKITSNWNTSLQLSRTINTAAFNELFSGVQLRDFASLSRNPEAINVTRENAFTHFITYKSILNGVIVSNSFKWLERESDFTFSSVLDANGLINTEAIELPNTFSGISNRLSFTKTFFRTLKTDLSYNYNNFQSEQLFNGIAQENNNTSHTGSLELSLDSNTWYGISYRGLYNFGQSQVNDFRVTNTFLKHNIELDFYTSSKTRFNLGMESVYATFSNNQNANVNTLLNSSFYYKPSKKLFLRASLLNILGERFFTTSSSSANAVQQSQFSLRPRQFTLGFNYSF